MPTHGCSECRHQDLDVSMHKVNRCVCTVFIRSCPPNVLLYTSASTVCERKCCVLDKPLVVTAHIKSATENKNITTFEALRHYTTPVIKKKYVQSSITLIVYDVRIEIKIIKSDTPRPVL